MKQTAVEWLVDQMLKQGFFDGNKPLTFTNLDHLVFEAKQMEKQQIIDAANQNEFEDVDGMGISDTITKGKQYYNETYREQLKSKQ